MQHTRVLFGVVTSVLAAVGPAVAQTDPAVLQTACDAGKALACFELALAVGTGKAGPADAEKAKSLRARAMACKELTRNPWLRAAAKR